MWETRGGDFEERTRAEREAVELFFFMLETLSERGGATIAGVVVVEVVVVVVGGKERRGREFSLSAFAIRWWLWETVPGKLLVTGREGVVWHGRRGGGHGWSHQNGAREKKRRKKRKKHG